MGGGGGEDSHANRGGDARRTSQGLKSWVLVPLRDQSEFKLGGGGGGEMKFFRTKIRDPP